MPETIILTVTPAEAQAILAALAARPYAEVGELIPRLIAEANNQIIPDQKGSVQ